MKSYNLLLFCIISHLYAYSYNNYPYYYHKIRAAKKLLLENKKEEALINYDSAFTAVNYIHKKNLIDATECAKTIQKLDKMLPFWYKNISNGMAYSYGDINNYFDEKSIQKMDSMKKDLFNPHLVILIDSINRRDQYVRGEKFLHAKNYLDSLKQGKAIFDTVKVAYSTRLMYEWKSTDSLNIQELIEIIHKYGYPDERLVGEWASLNVFFILLHFDTDINNQELHIILQNALGEGKLKPSLYAWIIDRRLVWCKKELPYYYILPNDMELLSESEENAVNQRRYEIGLPPIDKTLIQKKGNNTYQFELVD